MTDEPHSFDPERAERAIREFLIAVGEDPERDGLTETRRGSPARFASSSPGTARIPVPISIGNSRSTTTKW